MSKEENDEDNYMEREFKRMAFDKDSRWRICDKNKDFQLCNTYPRYLILPANFSDKDLESVAKFRYFRRVPTAVWRHVKNGCFIVRSSQPTVGWFGWFRSEADENLLHCYVANTMSQNICEPHRQIKQPDQEKPKQQEPQQQRKEPERQSSAQTDNNDKKQNEQSRIQSRTDQLDNDNAADDQQDHDLSGKEKDEDSKTLVDEEELRAKAAAAAAAAAAATAGAATYKQQSTKIETSETNPAPTQVCTTNPTTTTTATTTTSSTTTQINLESKKNDSQNGDATAATTTTTNENDNKNSTVNNNTESTIEQSNSISKLLVIDARSYTAAMANRAKGGGCECSEYYPKCEVQFMNLANIHSIRKSFHAIKSVVESYSEQSNNWLSFLDNSGWLHHISGLLKSALLIVDTIDIEEKSILIHCSDGWDRTPQLVALAEIMLDSHYRTFDGFRTLIQREWLDFGHKFADRCGTNRCNEDPNERCPVFLQWLDCVQQLLMQYPRHFEFNSLYLDKLNRHTFSDVFGTFSYNSTHERKLSKVEERVLSLWSYFESSKRRFRNENYVPSDEILRPSYKIRDLHFWKQVYCLPTSKNQQPYKSMQTNTVDNKRFYDSLYLDGITRTVCK